MERNGTRHRRAARSRRRETHPAWVAIGAFALWLGLFTVYTANRRAAGAGDTVPATLLAVALVRGDGPVLDRFDDILRTPTGQLPGYAQDARGHAVSRYPIGPALMAAPLVAPQVWWLDWNEPGWERDRANLRLRCTRLAKTAAAAMVAGTAVLLWGVLRRLGLGLVALPAVITVSLGSGDFSVASQALWQHGPAALCLAVVIALLATIPAGTASPRRLAIAGFFAAMMVACRPVDLPFAALLALWVVFHHNRPRRWAFCLPAALVAIALSTYHLYFFDTLTGGYAKIEQMHPWAHGVKGSWATPLLTGIAGTLFSPSHGLFVYSPWVLVALLVLPWSWRTWASRMGGEATHLERASIFTPSPLEGGGYSAGPAGALSPHPAPGATSSSVNHRDEAPASLASHSVLIWMFMALIPTLIILSKYSCWWGGHCFGARFWIDANPLFAVMLALGLDWAKRRAQPLFTLMMMGALAAIVVNAVGWACYPSTWHGRPVNADLNHERLWDWSDTEITRGWREGPRPAQW